MRPMSVSGQIICMRLTVTHSRPRWEAVSLRHLRVARLSSELESQSRRTLGLRWSPHVLPYQCWSDSPVCRGALCQRDILFIRRVDRRARCIRALLARCQTIGSYGSRSWSSHSTNCCCMKVKKN